MTNSETGGGREAPCLRNVDNNVHHHRALRLDPALSHPTVKRVDDSNLHVGNTRDGNTRVSNVPFCNMTA